MLNVLVYVKTDQDDKEFIREKLLGKADVFFLEDIRKNIGILDKIDIVITGSGRELNKEFLQKMRSLKFIQLLAAGADKVPFEHLSDRIIVASNAGGNAIAVAEHAIGLLLCILKNICFHDSNMRRGIWNRRKYGSLIYGKTVCVVGHGHIGCELSRRLKAFGAKIIGFNRHGRRPCEKDAAERVLFIDKIHDFLGSCDIIFITLPLNKYTRGFVNADFLSKVKSDSILINVGRGEVINQRDFYQFLRNNKEFRAGIDVWWDYPSEPYAKNFYQKYPFHKLNNVVMTPHIAGFSKEIRRNVFENALKNVIRFINGEQPKNIINPADYL